MLEFLLLSGVIKDNMMLTFNKVRREIEPIHIMNMANKSGVGYKA
jgi:hypothetical protein